jgi:hypothetical protein
MAATQAIMRTNNSATLKNDSENIQKVDLSKIDDIPYFIDSKTIHFL